MNNQTMKKRFFEGKKFTVILHLLAWTIFIVIPLYFIKGWPVSRDFIWLFYINTLVSGIIFYINYLLLAPKLFFETRKFRYFISVFVMVIIFYFVSDISNKMIFNRFSEPSPTEQKEKKPDRHQKITLPGAGGNIGRPKPPFRNMHLYNYGLNSLFLVVFSLGLRVLERNSQIEKLQKETEKAKLNSELAFLKSQISPHFLFNTLNNIYSLIRINPEDSQNAVLKLSKLMRYLLYESEQGNTRLSSEIGFMQNYIDLMKLRMSERVELKIEFPNDYEDVSIPPLLFVPFIENAFKHGISYREKSFIEIRMELSGNLISFKCANSIVKQTVDEDTSHNGIGLDNAVKRLNLLFPGKHDLQINKSDKIYVIILKINLS